MSMLRFEQREWGRWLLGRAEPGQMADGGALVNQAAGVLLTTISALAGLLVILFVGLYVSAQPSLYHRGLRRLLPVAGRRRVDEVLFEVPSVLRWWLFGKILSMVLVGVLTTVGLWWLDVPLALTIMSQIVLGVLVGAIGVDVATPLTAAAMTMVRMLYVEDLLEHGAPAEDS